MTFILRSLRVLLLAFAAGGLCAPAMGQVAASEPGDIKSWWAQPFAAQPGKKELSGRLIVRPKQRPDLAALGETGAELRDREARSNLLRFNPTVVPEVDEYFVTVPAGSTEDTLAAELLATGLYEWVRPDWTLYPTQARSVVPDDPLFMTQWNLVKINAPSAWDISPGLPTAIIAVVDTGVDFTHPDLAANMVLGYCSYILERQPQTTGPPGNTIVMDSHGHGTGVAGVIAALGNNALGIAGVGWNLRVMPVRASSTTNSGASFGDIQQGVLWATSHGVRIATVSYTGVEEPAVEALGSVVRGRNAMLVWPMDNNGWDADARGFPFDHPSVTVVSGTDAADERWIASWNPQLGSSYGRGVDLAAPSWAIPLTTIGGGYGTGEGNSYSGPTCAAALAMIWGLGPNMQPHEVESVLLASVDDIGEPGDDSVFGAGRLNLRRALWNAVVRQNALSLPTAVHNESAFSIDDVYDFLQRPMDVTGDQAVDDKDILAVHAFMRRHEAKDLGHARR